MSRVGRLASVDFTIHDTYFVAPLAPILAVVGGLVVLAAFLLWMFSGGRRDDDTRP
jgi:hypothetical protein